MKNFTIRLAKEAGKILMRHYGRVKMAREKFKDNWVTNADLESERMIITAIQKKYPSHSILSEEKGKLDKKSDYKWIIDPLDGTHNYLQGLPIFGVSIGLEYRKEVILGVIYLPVYGWLFTVEKGKGAFLNGRRVHVSRRSLHQSMLMYDGSINTHRRSKLRLLDLMARCIFRIRISGAAVFDLVSVAQGTSDISIAMETKPWDVAAGFLLVREAGGTVTDFRGHPIDHYTGKFVASNGKLHGQVIKLTKRF